MEQLKERIKYNLERLRAMLVLGLADATGLASLLRSWTGSSKDLFFLIIGFLLIFALIIGTLFMHQRITADINKLN